MTTRFDPVPNTPNCVSSRAPTSDAQHSIAALPPTDAERLKSVMLARPRTELVEEDGAYLHFVETSWLFRFKDDIEFELEDDVTHVRSASRTGYGDMGVNRKRVEAIRSELA